MLLREAVRYALLSAFIGAILINQPERDERLDVGESVPIKSHEPHAKCACAVLSHDGGRCDAWLASIPLVVVLQRRRRLCSLMPLDRIILEVLVERCSLSWTRQALVGLTP